MAEAFQVDLTAIYVKPSDYDALSEADKQRLQSNLRFAEQCGASITTLYGDDVPTQIAEYAHISGATKIVVGRSGARRRHFWSKPPLTEQLIVNAPDVDGVVYLKSCEPITQGKRYSVKITGSDSYDLYGEITNELT